MTGLHQERFLLNNGVYTRESSRSDSALGVSQSENEVTAIPMNRLSMSGISHSYQVFSNLTSQSHMLSTRIGKGRKPAPTPPMKRILLVPDPVRYERAASREKSKRFVSPKPSGRRGSRARRGRNSAPKTLGHTTALTDISNYFRNGTGSNTTMDASSHVVPDAARYERAASRETSKRIVRKNPSGRPGSRVPSRSATSPLHQKNQSNNSQFQDDVIALTREQDEVIDWMHSIGVYINFEKQHHGYEITNVDVIEVFRTGIKLAELVQRLEKVDIKGIDKNTAKPAAILNNINKALIHLRKRKNMDDTHLWSAREICNGNVHTIWGLLLGIYKEYSSKNWQKFFKGRKRERTPSRHRIQIPEEHNSSSRSNTSVGRSPSQRESTTTTTTTTTPSPMQNIRRSNGNGNVHQPFRSLNEKQTDASVHASYLLQGSLPIDITKDKLCTVDMEREVLKWFHETNFDALLAGRRKDHTLSDTLRNGVFLCELVGALENNPIVDVNRNPIVLSEARENIEKALGVLRQRNSVPTVYLFNGEAILQGNHETVWGLFYYIMKTYPNAASNPRQHYSKSSSLYDSRSMRTLEQSLLFWLGSLGLFPASLPFPKSIEDIKQKMSNGTLLCELVSIVEGRKLIGVNRNPKVKSAFLSNINKALDLLRRRKAMGTQFLWSEEELMNGDVNVILGLLEDIHRSYDGHPPRNVNKTPYFGRDNGHAMQSTQKNMSANDSHNKLLPLPATPPTELRAMLPTPSKYSSIEQRSYPEPFFPSSQLSNVLLPAPHEFNASVNTMYQSNYQHQGQYQQPTADFVTEQYHQSHNPGQRVSLSANTNAKHPKTFLLAKWLESLGIKLQSSFSLDGPTIHEFSDGVLLCRLVSKLEHKKIEGVTERPKKHASFLHNIRKALQVLRNKKTMPIDLLYSERDIVRGNGPLICILLEQMKRAYHHHEWHT